MYTMNIVSKRKQADLKLYGADNITYIALPRSKHSPGRYNDQTMHTGHGLDDMDFHDA